MRVKHSWMSRTIPPLVGSMVLGCVWYAWHNRPTDTPVAFTPTSATAQASTDVLPPTSPVVQKQGSDVQFSVPATPYTNVQKVEYYVENQFVGVAYSQPYTVVVSENSLTAGTHQVTAKIFTPDTTTQSTPAVFTAQPSAPPEVTPSSNLAPTTPADPTPAPATPPATPSLDAPTDLSGTIADDNSSVTISWTASSGATRYQVWRDGSQIATATGTGYTDTGLTTGYTYDYRLIAMDAAGHTSAPSQTLAVTIPTPQPTGPVNNSSANSSSQSMQDSTTQSDTTSDT